MPHHVYANNNEIATKSANGKSSAAAPDVCFTTPPSVAAGTPVPFTNTCKAKDITKGSRTVLIKNGEVALEDKSYFKKSSGDEGATKAHKKGVISGNITGRGFFVSWSPNVKIEGLCVARHMDSVTHNHSNPTNTPIQIYKSVFNTAKECAADKKKMDKKCKSEEDRANEEKEQANKKQKPKKKKKSASSKNDNKKPTNWVEEQCGPISVKPGLAGFEEWKKEFGDLDKLMDGAAEQLKSEVIGKLEQEVLEFAAKKATAFAARRLATGWIPIVGWVISAVDAAATGYEIAETLPKMKEELAELKDTVKNLKDESKKIKDLFSKHKDKLENFGALSEEEQKSLANEVMSDSQAAYAAANPCLRARKCLMVGYNDTKSTTATKNGKACCAGQTGHHLMPDAMFRVPGQSSDIPRNEKQTAECWGNYDENPAPTICLEGGASRGSHGMFHSATKELIKPFGQKSASMNYTTARNATTGIASAAYGCDQKCLNAQMDKYYEEANSCGESLKDAKVVAHTGASHGAPKKPSKKSGKRKN